MCLIAIMITITALMLWSHLHVKRSRKSTIMMMMIVNRDNSYDGGGDMVI